MNVNFRAARRALRDHLPRLKFFKEGGGAAARLGSQAGFTYLAALVAVIVLAISATQAVNLWSMQIRREKEVELLWRMTQYRNALISYYKGPPVGPGAIKPPASPPLQSLDDLLKGNSAAGSVRYLRKLYLDPITGKEFEPVKDGNGIVGVKSTSELEPVKKANFPDEFIGFEGKKKYNEWWFNAKQPPPLRGSGGGVQGLGGSSNPGGSNPSFDFSGGGTQGAGGAASGNSGVPGWGAPPADSTVGVPGWSGESRN